MIEPARQAPQSGRTFMSLFAFGLAGLLILLLSVVVYWALDRYQAQKEYGERGTPACKNRLKQIGVYFSLYEAKYKCAPGSLRDLYRFDMGTDPGIFICPVGKGDPKHWVPGSPWESFESLVAYEYRPYLLRPGSLEHPTSHRAIVWDRELHGGAGGERCVLFDDGNVQIFTQGDFERVLKEGEPSISPPQENSTAK